MENASFVVAEINETGRAALTAWLKEALESDQAVFAKAVAADLIDRFDGSFGDVVRPSVELSATRAACGHAVTYDFDAGEYDLVTYDDDGNELARKTA